MVQVLLILHGTGLLFFNNIKMLITDCETLELIYKT